METASVRAHAEASEAPGAVTSLTATSGDRKLDIAWQAPPGTVDDYDVHITASSTVDDDANPVNSGRPESGWRHTWNVYTGLVPSHTFDRLTNGTAHRVRVRATNSQGAGPWEFVTATPANVPGKPAVTVDAGKEELRVSWTAATGGSAITGYAVQYKQSDAADAPATTPNDPSTGWVAHAHSGAGRTATIGGLTDGTGYDVRVRATNANGDGPWSDAAQGTPALTVPDAPAVTATASVTGPGVTELAVSWEAPDDRGSAVTGYGVRYAETISEGGQLRHLPYETHAEQLTGTSTTITGLKPGITYIVHVRARNAAGWGAWSRQTVRTTPTTVPAKPAVTLDAGNDELGVSWTEPETGGSAITGYAVQYKQSDAADAPATTPNDPSTGWVAHAHSGTETTATIGGLTDGTGYDVRVRATNANGDGPWSDAAQGTPESGRVPDAPARPTGTGDFTELAVSWEAPYDRGSAITAYHVLYGPAGGTLSHWADDLTGTTTTITGLRPGILYFVRVRAQNAAGWSAWSPWLQVATSSTVPGKPAVTLDAGAESLGVSWTAETGGSAITGYAVQYKESDASDTPATTPNDPSTGWVAHAHSGTGTTATIGGLTDGTGYDVRVRAANAHGDGPWSDAAQGTPESGRVPAAPARPAATAGVDELAVSWTAPYDRGSAITAYHVLYGPAGGATSNWADDLTGTTATITGLRPGILYFVRVRAQNAAGWGAWSPWLQVATPSTVPGKPAVTVDGGNGELGVSWNRPSTGGLAITGYAVQYKESAAADAPATTPNDPSTGWVAQAHSGTGTRTAITGLTNGTAYDVRVRATNANGDGEWSDAGQGTPGRAAAPAVLDVRAGFERLDLEWTASLAAVTGYDVHYTSSSSAGNDDAASGNDPSAAWVDAGHTGTAASLAIAGLANGTEYRVRVRAVNTAGAGAWARGTGTPALTVPDAPAEPTVEAGVTTAAVSWTPPHDRGSAITAYHVQYFLNRDFWTDWRSDLTGTATTITGLLPGSAYGARVRAMNAAGWGAWSTYRSFRTRTTAWSATLNVKALGSGKTGCDNAVAAARCSSSAVLTDNGFRVGGADIAIQTIEDTGAGTGAGARFFVQFSTSNDALKALKFCVGSTAHALSELSSGHFLSKNAPGLVWEAGDTVSLSIGTTCQAGTPPSSAPGAPSGLQLEPGNARLDLRWVASFGTVAGYDVHYTSAPATGQDAVENNAELASDSNAATGWVDARHSGRRTAHAITGLANGTEYRVRVRGVNAAGASGWLHGTGMPMLPPPAAPTRLAVSPGDAKLDLSWTAPAGTLTGYDVHYTASATVDPNAAPGSDAAAAWVAVSRTGTTATQSITGLTNGTRYRVRVRAENTAGAGAWAFGAGAPSAAGTVWSATLTVQALGSGKTGCDNAVGGAQCSSVAVLTEDGFRAGGADIAIRTIEDTGTGTGAGARFFVQFSTSNAALRALNFCIGSTAHALSGLGTGHGLGRNAPGLVWLAGDSVFLSIGTSCPPGPASAPAKPTGFTAAKGDGRLDLTWTAPAGMLARFDVHYTSAPKTGDGAVGDDAAASGNDASAGWVDAGHAGTAVTHALTGLDNGTAYRVRVRAVNAAGAGAWEFAGGTPAGPTWQLGPADRYAVQEGASVRPQIQLSEPAPAGGLTWTLTPLFGDDVPSDRCKNYTGATARAVAADVGASPPATFTVAAGETRDTFAFPTAADTLYDELTECFAIRLTPAQAVIDAGWTLGTTTDPDAVLDVAEILLFNVVPPPAEPTGLTVTPDNAKLDLAWTAPSGTVTGYDVHYTSAPDTGQGAVGDDAEAGSNTDASAGWVAVDRGTEADPPAVSQSITSLTNGTAYRVRVRARRAASHGAWARGTGTPANPDAPSVPQNVTVTPGDAKLTIAWEAPASWGSWEAHSFFVQWKLSSAADSAYDSVRLPDGESYAVIAHTDTSLEFRGQQTSAGGIQYTVANGTAYDLRIQARSRKPNTDGTQDGHYRRGGWVAVTDTTPTADPPPGAPTGLNVTAGDGRLDLAWTVPSGTVTGYDVHYTSAPDTGQGAVGDDDTASGSDPAAGWVAVDRGTEANPPAASQAITGLVNGTGYRVRVRAVNAIGDSAWARETGTPAVQSSDATLSALAGSTSTDGSDFGGTLDIGSFSATTTRYEATVGSAVTHVKLTPTANQSNAVVKVGTGASLTPVPSGTASEALALEVGANALKVEVTAQDATVQTYTVTVKRRFAMPADLSASGEGKLALTWTAPAGGTLTGYDVHYTSAPETGSGAVPNDADASGADPSTAWVDAGHTGTTAAHEIAGLADGTPYRLRVRAKGAAGAGAWAFGTGTPMSTDATPSALTASGSTSAGGTYSALALTPSPFSASETSYRATVASGITHVKLTPTASHAAATVGVRKGSSGAFTPVASGRASAALALEVGANALTVRVTAQDTVTVKDYTVTVTRRAPDAPLTAAFEGVPAEHDGKTAFSVLLRLSEPASSLSQAPRAASFRVRQGRLERIERAGADLWRVWLKPITMHDVQVTLEGGRGCAEAGAVCTRDGRALRNTVKAMVGEQLRIFTWSTFSMEGRDSHIEMRVGLSRSGGVEQEVTVDWETVDGTTTGRELVEPGRRVRYPASPATAGADYTAASGTLTFAPGEWNQFVKVPILDDAVDEGTEYFLIRFSNPQGAGAVLAPGQEEQMALITNDDHLQTAWLARFGRTVGSQVTEAVSERLGSDLAPGAHATLAGQRVDLSQADDGEALARTLTGLARAFGAEELPAAEDDPGSRAGSGAGGAGAFGRHGLADPWNNATATAARSVTGRELLLGSAFHLATGDERSGPGLAAWGRVALGSFEGEHADDTGHTRVDGEVLTGVLGADADFGRVLAGVAVSLSEGDGSFGNAGADVGGKGGIESRMTTVSPYARFRLTERVTAWGLAGWGTGDMTIRFDDGRMAPVRTDLSMQLGAIGAKGALMTQDEAGGMDLALKADAFFVRTESEKAVNSVETQADASRVRLVLEGGRAFALSETATLRPSLELGVRHDGGDAETGTGVEFGGGVAFTDEASGLSIEARARMLAAHADSDYGEWGASATARLDPGEHGRGLSFSLSPAIGASSSAAERLWAAHDVRALAPVGTDVDAARSLQAELGYGMALPGGFTGTPNLGLGMSDDGARDWRIGWRLTPPSGGGFELNLDAIREERVNGAASEHGVMVRSVARW